MKTPAHPADPPPAMAYELALSGTSAGTGYCACLPAAAVDLEGALVYLRAHPYDDFMHRHALQLVARMPPDSIGEQISQTAGRDPVFRALLLEACLLVDSLQALGARFETEEAARLGAHTPAVFIRSALQPDQALHAAWARVLGANIRAHHPLPAPGDAGLPPLFAPDTLLDAMPAAVSPAAVSPAGMGSRRVGPGGACADGLRPAAETAGVALERLQSSGLLAGPEMRHEASLSPWALLRKWHLTVGVRCGRHRYTLTGIQAAYGKGLTLEGARASCLMEIVERVSAFASIGPEGPTGYKEPQPLARGRRSELRRGGAEVLDPNRLNLEVGYRDEPLYWIEGRRAAGESAAPILVPAQAVYLFCNLDEVALFSGLGSSGLAAGASMAQARGSALLEIVERDAAAISPYDPRRCFRLSSEDAAVTRLLDDYRSRGIDLFFQDLTPPLGIPCYACAAVLPDGSVVKGSGAHLDGKRAALSALTETPYPYPYGPPSRPAPRGIPFRRLEDLPDYSTGSPVGDLGRIEGVLLANGLSPLYVDLTRSDLDLPAVRAIVPGLELMADFDRFSRIGRRLWNRYLDAARGGPDCR